MGPDAFHLLCAVYYLSAQFPNNGRLRHYDVKWLYDDLLTDDVVEQDQLNEETFVQIDSDQPEQTVGSDQGLLPRCRLLNVLYKKIYQEITSF